ncbi:MAG: hypothetical protein HQM12_20370 [SAR324 cluster bacterium]|nr:hypothetical protein [SAR324 cluster bacterium]
MRVSAYMFSGQNDFLRFIRMQQKTCLVGYQKLCLYRIHLKSDDPSKQSEAWILSGWPKKNYEHFDETMLEIEVSGNTLGFQPATKFRKPFKSCEILFQKTGESLEELLPLEPWGKTPDMPKHVIFQLQARESTNRLIRQCFELGNDRIQVARASITDQDALWLRVESPSWFLLLQYLEQPEDCVVWNEVNPGIWLPWGWSHPMESMLRECSSSLQNGLRLFTPTEIQNSPLPDWNDVYTLTDLKLDKHESVGTLTSPRDIPRFQITLSLIGNRELLEPKVWVIPIEEVNRIESLLSVLAEEELDKLKLSILQDARGQGMFILRQYRQSGTFHFPVDTRGVLMTEFMEFSNLMVPRGQTLFPPLRRDRYHSLLGLRADALTLVMPEGDMVRVMRIPDSSFKSVHSYVDYLIQQESTLMTTMLNKSVFDFGHFYTAPKLPERVGNPVSNEPVSGKTKPIDSESRKAPGEEASETEAPSPQSEPEVTKPEPQEIQQNITTEEILLERKILFEGQSKNLWTELLKLKLKNQMWAAVVECVPQVLWWCSDQEDPTEIWELWSTGLNHLLKTKSTAQNNTRLKDLSRILEGLVNSEQQSEGWEIEISKILLKQQHELNRKTKWLLWEKLARYNNDARNLSLVSNEVRHSSDYQLWKEIPEFLISRLKADLVLDSSTTGKDGSLEKGVFPVFNFKDVTSRFAYPENSIVFGAMLVRAFSNIIQPQLAGQILSQIQLIPMTTESRKWCSAFLEYDYPEHPLLQWVNQNQNKWEKEPFFENLKQKIKQSSFVNDPTGPLSSNSRDRLCPSGAAYASNLLYKKALALDESQERSAQKQITLIEQALELIQTENEDSQGVARLSISLAEGLVRIHHTSSFESLENKFEMLVSGCSGNYPTHPMNQLIRDISFAKGLVMINRIAPALSLMKTIARNLRPLDNLIDFKDVSNWLLTAIAELPMSERFPILNIVMDVLKDHCQKKGFLPELTEYFRQFYLLLDSWVETAMTNDKRILMVLEKFQLQESTLILERINQP